MYKRLTIIRHGETEHNRLEVVQGQMDIDLNDGGRKQAEALVPELKDEPLEVIFSSDLKRAYNTAVPLAQSKKLEIIATADLRERHLGPLQGKTWGEVKVDPNNYYQQLHDESKPDWKTQGAESLNELYTRVASWVTKMESTAYRNIGVVTHGGTIKVLLKVLGFEELSRECAIANTDYSIFEKIDGTYVLVRTNMKHCDRTLSIDETLALKIPTVVKEA